MDLTCAILAGGRSRRMGRDKAWIPVAGRPLIARVIERLQPHFPRIVVSANDPAYDALGFPRIPDRLSEPCPLTGIHAVLLSAPTPWCFLTACDMPFVSVPLLRNLAGRCEGHDVVVPESSRGLEPLHALYSRACIPAIEEAGRNGRWKISDFFPSVRTRIVPVVGEDWTVDGRSPFSNVNTPEDLREAAPGKD